MEIEVLQKEIKGLLNSLDDAWAKESTELKIFAGPSLFQNYVQPLYESPNDFREILMLMFLEKPYINILSFEPFIPILTQMPVEFQERTIVTLLERTDLEEINLGMIDKSTIKITELFTQIFMTVTENSRQKILLNYISKIESYSIHQAFILISGMLMTLNVADLNEIILIFSRRSYWNDIIDTFFMFEIFGSMLRIIKIEIIKKMMSDSIVWELQNYGSAAETLQLFVPIFELRNGEISEEFIVKLVLFSSRSKNDDLSEIFIQAAQLLKNLTEKYKHEVALAFLNIIFNRETKSSPLRESTLIFLKDLIENDESLSAARQIEDLISKNSSASNLILKAFISYLTSARRLIILPSYFFERNFYVTKMSLETQSYMLSALIIRFDTKTTNQYQSLYRELNEKRSRLIFGESSCL
ncbi:MAG: hypothetical protein LBJ93_00420 [Clostridiales bacterium]|jgi:hypothetical protein|nr:hypothetical protein [Clostridiales bacterium]